MTSDEIVSGWADYLRHQIGALPSSTPDSRRTVYMRAEATLRDMCTGPDGRPDQGAIEAGLGVLDQAIGIVESEERRAGDEPLVGLCIKVAAIAGAATAAGDLLKPLVNIPSLLLFFAFISVAACFSLPFMLPGKKRYLRRALASSIVVALVSGFFVVSGHAISGAEDRGTIAAVLPELQPLQDRLLRIEGKIDRVDVTTAAIDQRTQVIDQRAAAIDQKIDVAARGVESTARTTNEIKSAVAKLDDKLTPDDRYRFIRLENFVVNNLLPSDRKAPFDWTELKVQNPGVKWKTPRTTNLPDCYFQHAGETSFSVGNVPDLRDDRITPIQWFVSGCGLRTMVSTIAIERPLQYGDKVDEVIRGMRDSFMRNAIALEFLGCDLEAGEMEKTEYYSLTFPGRKPAVLGFASHCPAGGCNVAVHLDLDNKLQRQLAQKQRAPLVKNRCRPTLTG